MNDAGSARGLTLWHYGFYQLIMERRPPSSDVRTEVPLSQHPSRVDLLLLRRTGEPRRDAEARVLRGLWPHLGEVAIADFKSPTREFRASELMRLLRYGMEYHELSLDELASAETLSLVLFVPRMNKALREEIARVRCTLELLGDGYARLTGPLLYTTYIVFLDEVAEAEHDEYLRIFTTHKGIRDPAARRWIEQWLVGAKTVQNTEDMEGYDELLDKLLASVPIERRLAGLSPEEVLARFSPEERLAGLSLEQLDALRALLAKRDEQ